VSATFSLALAVEIPTSDARLQVRRLLEML
jgi:hypothetical protein